MYRMLYNDSFLFDPFDETRIVSSASITTNVNAASYLDFTIAATHPLYDTIEQRSGTITLYSDNEKLFQGQITSIDMDMDGNKSVTCSSALDWLKDVQLRPYSTDQAECNEYEFKLDKAPDALDAYFQWLIDQYNAQNKDNRYFTINVNQAADLTNRNIVYFASTSPRSVADAIEEDILKTFGGYLVLRYEDDQLILDLYSDIHEMNEQVIDYGENILDISRSESTDDQYTAVYPIGATPQYTTEQQKYHDEKDAYDEYMKQRDAAEKAAIDKLKKEEDAEQKRINGMGKGPAKANAQDALRRRKEQRQAREQKFSDETKRLQDAQKIKDDKNAADKTKPNPITIESLNNGGYPGDLDIFKEGDVVYSVSHVARYGYKEFVYNESNVHDKTELLILAVAKLKTLMAPMLTIDVRAVDQALYNPKHRHLFAGQAVRVRSKAHKVDEFMMVSSIDLDLIDPSKTTATLGVAYDTLTGQQSSFMRNLNSKIVSSVDAVDKLGENVKTTEITLGKVETVVENTNNKADLIINTVDDYKWMTDTAWGKADDAQADADKANQGVTDTNIRIDNIKIETDERIDGINTEIDNTKTEIEQAKQTAEQIRQDAQAGIEEAKQQAEAVRTEANTAINTVKTDLAATEAKAELAQQNASSALGGLSSANAQIDGLRVDVNRQQEHITNIDGEIVGVKDTISGVSETANSALSVATTNTHSIAENSNRIDTAYSDIEATRTSVSEVKQTADGLKVNLETNYLDKNAIGANYASKAELTATSESITSTVEKTYATKSALEGLQNIADAAIETWSGRAVPTASNPPASTWTTDALKRQHRGDIYYDMTTGKSYRWGSENGTSYSWTMIADNDITKAIADAAKAQQTADGAKQDVVNLSNNVKATYTSKSEFKQTSDEIKASVNEVASANETNAQKIAEVSVKADGISAKVAEQAETISGHTTTIGQLSVKADGLQTKFEQVSDNLTELTDNLDGLINQSFSTNSMYGWTIRPTDKARMSSYDREPGGPYLVIDSSNAIFLATIINDGILTFAPKHRYRVTIMMKVTHAEYFSSNEGITIRLAKPNYANMSDWVDGFYANVQKSEVGTTWKSYSKDIVIGEYGATGHLRLAFQPTANTNASFAIKSVKIEDITEANTALTKTSELKQTLDGFTQTVSETYTTKNEFNNLSIGGTNLARYHGYAKWNSVNASYDKENDLYEFDIPTGLSNWGGGLTPKSPNNREYDWHQWASVSFDVYSDQACTFISDINNYCIDESGPSGNDHDLRSEAKKMLPDGSIVPIGGNSGNQGTIDIPANTWVRIGIICYNGSEATNPNHVALRDWSTIGFKSLPAQYHVKVRRIKFEVGNKPTDWSPSPFDVLDKETAGTTYTTKSEFTQTKNAITARVEENAESIAGHTTSIGQLQVKSNEISSKVEGVTETANTALTQSATAIQNLTGFKQTVEQNYATKTQLTDEMKKSVKTIEIRGRMDGNYWWKLGRLTMPQQGKDFHIDYTGGRGYHGLTEQNSQLEIHVRSGNGGGTLFAVTVNRLFNADMYTVKAFVIDATHIDLYLKSGHQYSTGTMAYYGPYTDFSGAKQIDDISTAEGTELTVLEQSLSTKSYVQQTAESVSIGVVEDFKDGKHGDKLTTQSNLTALKDEINASVSEQYADLSDQIKLANSDNAVGKNFSFESNNFDGWASHDRWAIGTNGAHTGRYYAQNTIPANSNGEQLISMGSIAAEYGHTYKLEYWVKKKPNSQCRGVHRISYKRSGVWEDMPSDVGTTIFLDDEGKTNIDVGTNGGFFDVTDSWTKVTTYIIPPSTVTDIRVRILGNNPGSAETVFAVDDVSLTDYSVAKTINKTMAGISVKADSITQEVRNNYATKDLVNRSIPGLKNPNFDAQKDGDMYTIAGWSVLGPWNETRLGNSGPVNSEGGTYFVGKSGTTAGQTLELINKGYISAYPGMKVQISWWMCPDSNIFQNANFSAGIIANNVVTRNLLSDYSIGGWKYMTTTITVPDNANQFRVRFGFVTTGTSGWLRLDSVSVTDVTEAKVALGKATTVESNLEHYKTTVSKTYATKDTVTEMQSQWKQTAQGFEAAITANSHSVPVINSGFESGNIDGWEPWGFSSYQIDDKPLITRHVTHYFKGVFDSGQYHGLRNLGSIVARKGDHIKVTARVLVVDSQNDPLSVSVDIGYLADYNGVPYFKTVRSDPGGWSIISATLSVNADSTFSAWIRATVNNTGCILCVDDVVIENVSDAVQLRNDLETRIAMTANGVRVGKTTDGNFVGMSALVNSEGSFDILNGEEVQATLSDSNVGLMRDASTGKYRFQIKPYALNGKNGTNLLSYGQLSLNSMPTVPATDSVGCSLPGGQATVNNGPAYIIPWDAGQFQTNGLVISDPVAYRTNYYQTVMNGEILDDKAYRYAVGILGTSSNDCRTLVFLNPGLYAVQYNAHVNHSKNGYFDYCLRFKAPGASSFVSIAGAPDWRGIEVADPAGYLQRTSIISWVYVDAGTQMQLHVKSSLNNQKLSTGNRIHVTRMPFGCALMN